jgi:hypothetical protein
LPDIGTPTFPISEYVTAFAKEIQRAPRIEDSHFVGSNVSCSKPNIVMGSTSRAIVPGTFMVFVRGVAAPRKKTGTPGLRQIGFPSGGAKIADVPLLAKKENPPGFVASGGS